MIDRLRRGPIDFVRQVRSNIERTKLEAMALDDALKIRSRVTSGDLSKEEAIEQIEGLEDRARSGRILFYFEDL